LFQGLRERNGLFLSLQIEVRQIHGSDDSITDSVLGFGEGRAACEVKSIVRPSLVEFYTT
jgi:hypothetical protein